MGVELALHLAGVVREHLHLFPVKPVGRSVLVYGCPRDGAGLPTAGQQLPEGVVVQLKPYQEAGCVAYALRQRVLAVVRELYDALLIGPLLQRIEQDLP